MVDSGIDEIRSAARILGIPDDVLLFNEGSMTGFDDRTGKFLFEGIFFRILNMVIQCETNFL